MPRISAQKLQDRYDAIVQAARTTLAAKGFEAASISEIARRANVSDGLIYRYFTDKRALLMAVLGQFYKHVIEDLEEAVGREDGFERQFRALVATHIRVFSSDPEICRLFLTEVRVANNYRDSEIYKMNRQYTSILVRITQVGIDDGIVSPDVDPRMLRDLLFGGIEHFAWRHINDAGSVDLELGAVRIAEMLLSGIFGRSK